MTDTTSQDMPVRQAVVVAVPQARAFAIFTEQIGRWWPLKQYAIGSSPAVDATLEPYQGGRWYERDAVSRTCTWGHVRSWEPPDRLVLSWEISADWRPDPALASEVEVRFVAEPQNHTRVELEHRGLGIYGEQAFQLHAVLDSDQGWSTLLRAFGDHARMI